MDNKLIERIRKLLALAESPNEHEAALASERAQALLAEHKLSLAQVTATHATPADPIGHMTASLPNFTRPLARID